APLCPEAIVLGHDERQEDEKADGVQGEDHRGERPRPPPLGRGERASDARPARRGGEGRRLDGHWVGLLVDDGESRLGTARTVRRAPIATIARAEATGTRPARRPSRGRRSTSRRAWSTRRPMRLRTPARPTEKASTSTRP